MSTSNEEPNEKWWQITRMEIGIEAGSPNWVRWATEKIKQLEKERAKYKQKLDRAVDLIEEMLEDMCVSCRVHNPQHKDCDWCEQKSGYEGDLQRVKGG